MTLRSPEIAVHDSQFGQLRHPFTSNYTHYCALRALNARSVPAVQRGLTAANRDTAVREAGIGQNLPIKSSGLSDWLKLKAAIQKPLGDRQAPTQSRRSAGSHRARDYLVFSGAKQKSISGTNPAPEPLGDSNNETNSISGYSGSRHLCPDPSISLGTATAGP